MKDKNTRVYVAYLIADKIDLGSFKRNNTEKLISATSSELYYQIDNHRFVYLLSYGVVVFSGMSKDEMQVYIERIKPFSLQWKDQPVEDDLEVEYGNDNQITIGFNALRIGRYDHQVNKMVMLNLAQTVALDHFAILGENMLEKINGHTDLMRTKGRILLSKKNALRFIGNTLSTKNNIAEHLYILDSPEVAWEDEFIDHLHKQLVRHFELAQRYRSLENTLRIIGDNLDVYISYNNHRESSRLEWIIIILIVIEVLDTFLSKI